MNIAIIGAGYSGLALAWHLSPKHNITVFSLSEPSASSVSTGLLHPFLGKFPTKSKQADLAMREAKELIEIAQQYVEFPIASFSKIFRAAIVPAQKKHFQKLVRQHDLQWGVHPKACFEGIWINEGITVFSKLYLKGLQKACVQKGVQFIHQEIQSLASLQDFDRVILACGPKVLDFFDLPLELIKGQVLICKAPNNFKLSVSIIGKGHISLTDQPDIFYLGSTYERDFTHSHPDEKAEELLHQMQIFVPEVKHFQILEKASGVRVHQKNTYLPFIQKMDEKIWIFTAFGSRGLLYHALYAKEFAKDRI